MTEIIIPENSSARQQFKASDVEFKHLLFPVKGSGIVNLADCNSDTSGDYEARLVTDPERTKVFCHGVYCRFYVDENTLEIEV